jgi:hypothetical protein
LHNPGTYTIRIEYETESGYVASATPVPNTPINKPAIPATPIVRLSKKQDLFSDEENGLITIVANNTFTRATGYDKICLYRAQENNNYVLSLASGTFVDATLYFVN